MRPSILHLLTLLIAASVLIFARSEGGSDFHFAILGDRTGEAQPGVYEEAWREVNASHPDFVMNVGDTIQGGNDNSVEGEWRAAWQILSPYRRIPIYFTPGNHDVWSEKSARAYQTYTKHPLHYSFDYKQAHFTVLDNSRTEQLAADEFTFLAADLKQHSGQPLKFVFSHRPSWILQALLGSHDSAFQHLAERYGVQYYISGHIHQMLRFNVKGVTYMCMGSSGGHLRDTKRYESGWFFEQTEVAVHENTASFAINELAPPFGQGRISHPEDWGAAGLTKTNARATVPPLN